MANRIQGRALQASRKAAQWLVQRASRWLSKPTSASLKVAKVLPRIPRGDFLRAIHPEGSL